MKHFHDASSDTHLLVLAKGEELMQQLSRVRPDDVRAGRQLQVGRKFLF